MITPTLLSRLGLRPGVMPHEGDEGAAHKAASEGPSEAAENSEVGGVRRLSAVTGQTLREHFHLPLHTVAQKFGMCTTAFKKMCRRLGIAKWPHRQVGSCLLAISAALCACGCGYGVHAMTLLVLSSAAPGH